METQNINQSNEIMTPDRAPYDRLNELKNDIRATNSILGFCAVAGAAGVAGTVELVNSYKTGETPSVIAYAGPPFGFLSMGAVGIGMIPKSIELRSERRNLKNDIQATELEQYNHYQNNQELYQEEALKEAIHREVKTHGWPSDSEAPKQRI